MTSFETEPELVQQVLSLAVRSIEANGVFPTPAGFRKRDGQLEIYSFACDGSEALQRAVERARSGELEELVLLVDQYTKPGQGTSLDSALIVFHRNLGGTARIGVLEYSHNEGGEPTVLPLDWNNAFWTNAYAKVLAKLAL
jgi:hypothetical protein